VVGAAVLADLAVFLQVGEHAVKLIAEKPGITASEIARELKIKPNYMYRVLSDLQKDGKIRKDGRAYHPA
jgi:DNA-binding MarR family transcriptional regulator